MQSTYLFKDLIDNNKAYYPADPFLVEKGMTEVMSIWGEPKRKRKRVTTTKRELLLLRQNGKCAGCRKSFKKMRVTPRLHHIGKSNRIDALELLCPNCHSKAHKWKSKEDSWTGKKKRVLVKKRMGSKPKRKRRQKPKKSSDQWSDWSLDL